MIDDPTATDTLTAALRQASTVAVLTGADISADSGVPTFRDPQEGLWAGFRPEDLATPEAFERDPDRVWQWYRGRRQQLAEVEPNAGHYALARLAERLGDLRLVTQNVDGLHQRAGHGDVIEFHGNIHDNVCHRERRVVDADDDCDTAPHCPRCQARVRPGVVWFGEEIPPRALASALAAAEACDLFLAVGTSAEVYPAAGLADLAREHGARVAVVNPDAAAFGAHTDIAVQARAAEALPRVVERLDAACRR